MCLHISSLASSWSTFSLLLLLEHTGGRTVLHSNKNYDDDNFSSEPSQFRFLNWKSPTFICIIKSVLPLLANKNRPKNEISLEINSGIELLTEFCVGPSIEWHTNIMDRIRFIEWSSDGPEDQRTYWTLLLHFPKYGRRTTSRPSSAYSQL